ncbi:MAG TPA: Gfo/Idh/MocA family oxidoreductase [Trueperaceae bacterium]|nr:Gfo/Idh/MocA family oxidoreductase [Trueperaceae bacterium]
MKVVASPTQANKTRPSAYLDVAVIGLGAIGAAHVEAVRKAPSARLAAVVDVDARRASEVAAATGAEAFASIDDLLASANIDMAIIATPDSLHVKAVQKVAAAGIHVLLEKPIATTVGDAQTILAAVTDSGIKFTVGHCLRFDPKYAELKRRIGVGELGDIATVYARRQNQVGVVERLKGRVSSLLFLGVHDIDIVNWYIDSPPVAVYCASSSGVMQARGFAVDDVSFTTIRYANGAVAVVESGWLLPPTYPRSGHFELVATGSRGLGRLDEFDEGLWVANETFQHIPLVDRLTPQVQHFAEVILTGELPLVSGTAAALAMEIALAAELSARENREVRLPLARA